MAVSGLDRVVAFTLNLIAGATGIAVSNIPAIITDEALAVGNAFGSGRAKLYKVSELTSLATDFSDSGETYDAATAIASQNPKVNSFYVIKRSTPVKAVVTLTFSAALIASNVVTGTINGHTVTATYATSNAATLTAFASTIQALDEVLTAASNGTDTITITFEEQVEPSVGTFTVTLGASQATVTVATTTPATNIIDDIAAARAETTTNNWFCLLPTTTNTFALLAAAEATETYGGDFITLMHSTSAAIIAAGSTDVASLLKAEDYNFSGIFYHDDSTEMIHAAIASKCLAQNPGSVSFAVKRLTGATSSGLTSAQIGYAEGKNCNTYTDAGPYPLVMKGVMCSGVSIEAIRDSLYAKAAVELAIYNLLTTRGKLPFNEAGRQLLLSAANGEVKRMVAEGVFNPDEDNVFTVPEISAISAGDKAARTFTGCQLNAAHLAGAIRVTMTGNIKVA